MKSGFTKIVSPLFSKNLVKGKGEGGEVKKKPPKIFLCFCNVSKEG